MHFELRTESSRILMQASVEPHFGDKVKDEKPLPCSIMAGNIVSGAIRASSRRIWP